MAECTAATAAKVLAPWAARLEAATGWRLVYAEKADANRRLGITDGRRTVWAADWLWAGGPARRALNLRYLFTPYVLRDLKQC